MTLKEDLDVMEELNPFSPEDIFDLIIIGSGPAGMSAAICAGRAKLNVLMIDKSCLEDKRLPLIKYQIILDS